MKFIADTETGSFPADFHEGYITQCRRNLPLHVNGKTSTCEWKNIISNCEKKKPKIQRETRRHRWKDFNRGKERETCLYYILSSQRGKSDQEKKKKQKHSENKLICTKFVTK